MRVFVLIACLGTVACSEPRPFCAKLCDKQGVAKWVDVEHAYEVCVCRGGEAHLKKDKPIRVPEKEDETEAEHAERVKAAVDEATNEAVKGVDELSKSVDDLLGGIE